MSHCWDHLFNMLLKIFRLIHHELSVLVLDMQYLFSRCIKYSIMTDSKACFLKINIFQGQDDYLLESRSSIQFLIKLLKPISSSATEGKGSKIGSKLLALCKDTDVIRARLPDSNSSTILSKVQEILVSCKEMKSYEDDARSGRPELSPKWIALLTIEKACLSKISFEGKFYSG